MSPIEAGPEGKDSGTRPIKVVKPHINGPIDLPVSHTPSIGGENAENGYLDILNAKKAKETTIIPTKEPSPHWPKWSSYK